MTRSLAVRTWCAAALILALCAWSVPASAAVAMDGKKGFTKLSRGVVNVLTGWVEIPKRVMETSQLSGPAAGFTWGILRGLGHGFIRTAAGLYETATFPFPAPPNYAPILEPEYVFTTETVRGDTYDD